MTTFKQYYLTIAGNYIFIDEFLVNEETLESELIEMTEFQLSNSRINSATNVIQNKLQKVSVSIILNNFNLFTFQKSSEISISNEVQVIDAEGNKTDELITTISIEYIDNQFICNKQSMSFEEMLSFLSQNTGFAVVKSLI